MNPTALCMELMGFVHSCSIDIPASG